MVNTNIPLIAGHDVTIVIAENKKANKSCYMTLVNHTAGKYWFISNITGLIKFLQIEKVTGKSILFALLIWAGIAIVENSFGAYTSTSISVGASVAGIFLLYRVTVKVRSMPRLTKSLAKFMEKQARDILSKA